MSFDDLPDGWIERPLTDPQLVADVLDLMVSDADRRAGALAVLLCDDQARLKQPGIISDLDYASSPGLRCFLLGNLVESVSPYFDSAVFALAREDGLSITADDQSWAQAVAEACRAQLRLLGFHIVTRDGSRLVPGSVAA